MALLVMGVRRANRKIFASILAILGAVVFVVFGLSVTVLSKVPASNNAPKVGQKAPEFTLLDANRHPVALSSVVASAPRGVLLVFYRGYW
jgi:heme/copper-type cytochrome/quinol oxidase subunit 2